MKRKVSGEAVDVKEEELSYEEQRAENIRRNAEFLSSLGLDEVRSNFEKSKPKTTKGASRRGMTGAKRAPQAPTRRSSRVTVASLDVEVESLKRDIDFLVSEMPELSGAKLKERQEEVKVLTEVLTTKEAELKVMNDLKKANTYEQIVDNSTEREWGRTERIGADTLLFLDKPYNLDVNEDQDDEGDTEIKREGRKLVALLAAARDEVPSGGYGTKKTEKIKTGVKGKASARGGNDTWWNDYAERMSQLKCGEEGVAKVAQYRITSTMVHPSTSKLIVCAGDKTGRFGIWDVDNHSSGGTDGVYRYEPFVANLEAMACRAHEQACMYLGSRDGTVRSLDIEKGLLNLTFTAPESMYDIAFHSFDFNTHDSLVNTFLVGTSTGEACCIDPRTRPDKYMWRYPLHDTKLNSIQQHPTREHMVVSVGAGQKGDIAIWDTRKMGSTTKPTSARKHVIQQHTDVSTSSKFHSKSVNAALVSPDGSNLVSVSMDNTVKIWTTSSSCDGTFILDKAAHTIRHDNHTGRWLSTFHPAFDPKVPNAFLLGSMERPRRMELFTPSSGKATRAVVYKDEWLGAVVSRGSFHPTQDVVVGGNSSGRCYVFR